MSPYTLPQYLDRARSALDTPTLYWLGWGNHAGARPGTGIDARVEFQHKQAENPTVAAQYAAGMAQLGLHFEDLPRVGCDCSNYVCWALGVPTMITDVMVQDAVGAQKQFKVLSQALPGALLVYPGSGGGAARHVGHVGIVTQVNAAGEPLRVLHCAPENFLLTPPPGGARSAIAETDTAVFQQNPGTRVLSYLHFAA